MKITCQACQAKYTIADEKVVGKVVKIRCKKCGATIVVNGSESGAGTSQPPSGPTPADSTAKSGPPAAASAWTVNVADGDQRSMTEAQVADAYRSGVIGGDTFCWKDGMADWLPLRDIASLRAACGAAGPSARNGLDGLAAADAHAAGSHPAPPRPKTLPPAAHDTNGASSAVAARRPGGRAPDHDLFGAVAKAGGEDEVLTSAPAGDRLTGPASRGDGTVEAPKMAATNEASGLIDIRQLSAQMRATQGDDKKKSRVDDIMNLSGGAFSPTLAAPVLAAPSLEHISTPPPPSMLSGVEGASPIRSKAVVFLAIGAGVFFLTAAAALVVFLVRGREPAAAEEKASSSATSAEIAPSASASASQAAGGASAAHSAGPAEMASAAPPEPSSSAKEAAREPAKEPSHEAVHEAPHEAPKVREAPPAYGAPAAEFNMGEARAKLGAIAGNVQSCKRGEATGTGRVEIVFSPSGSVQSAVVMSGSPFDGTITAKCVEARFRGAHVPPFGGGPFTVTKSFTIN